MGIRKHLSGNEAVATALKQINPDVIAAYPITPSTEVVQYFSQYVADGQVDTEFVAVESEHSAMSACIGAAAAGGGNGIRQVMGTEVQVPVFAAQIPSRSRDFPDTPPIRGAGFKALFQ